MKRVKIIRHQSLNQSAVVKSTDAPSNVKFGGGGSLGKLRK